MFDETENKVAGVLLALSFVIVGGYGLIKLGSAGFLFLGIVTIQLAVVVVSDLLMCVLAAALLNMSFGEVKSAALRLAAVAAFPLAVAILLPSPLNYLVSLVGYYGLMMYFFELEFREVFILTILFTVVGAVVNGLFAAAMASKEPEIEIIEDEEANVILHDERRSVASLMSVMPVSWPFHSSEANFARN